MENTNLSEEAKMLIILDEDIDLLETDIEILENSLVVKHSKLEQLKERKKLLLNYLNTDNN